MAPPTRAKLLSLDFVLDAEPFVHVPSVEGMDLGSLDFVLDAEPFIGALSTNPESEASRCDGPPYPNVQAIYRLPGTAGAYLKAITQQVGEAFWPLEGGDLPSFAWTFWMSRDETPSLSSGVIIMLAMDPATVYLKLETSGSDQKLRLGFDDGDSGSDSTLTDPVQSFWEDAKAQFAIVHDPGSLRLYSGTNLLAALDTTALNMHPIGDGAIDFTIGANNAGSELLDFEITNIGLFADNILAASELGGMAEAEVQSDLGNPASGWSAETEPFVYLRDPPQDGIIPSAACDANGGLEGAEGGFDVGDGVETIMQPGIPKSFGDIGSGSPNHFAGIGVAWRDLGSGSPIHFAGVDIDSPRDEGTASPLQGRTIPDGAVFGMHFVTGNPITKEWWDAGRHGGVVSDEGGDPIVILGHWPHRGPWRVFFVGADGQVFPHAYQGTYSGVPGQGDSHYTSRALDSMRVVMPPLAVGVYDLRMVHLKNKITYPKFIRVMRRPTYRHVIEYLRGHK